MGTVAINLRRLRISCSSFLEWLLNFTITTALVWVFLGWTRDQNPRQMDPGSATSFMDIHYQKQYSVVHETIDQFKVVGSYPTEEEALTAALHCQINVFKAIQDQVLVQVRQAFPEKSLAWKLRMLQDAMEVYFLDVGFESLTDYFTVTDQPVTDVAPKKRKMATTPRGESKLAKSNTSCGIASTTALKTMSRYMYQTSPFGMS